MNNKKFWIVLGVVVVLVIGGLILFYSPQREETIKIGWIGPQTGDSAILGMDNVVAAQIAVDEINSKGGINGKQVESGAVSIGV